MHNLRTLITKLLGLLCEGFYELSKTLVSLIEMNKTRSHCAISYILFIQTFYRIPGLYDVHCSKSKIWINEFMKKPAGHCFKVYFNWNTVYVLRLIYFTLEPFALQKHNNVYEFSSSYFYMYNNQHRTNFQYTSKHLQITGIWWEWPNIHEKKRICESISFFFFSFFNLGILCHFVQAYYYCCYFLRGYYIRFVPSFVVRTRTFFRSLRSF